MTELVAYSAFQEKNIKRDDYLNSLAAEAFRAGIFLEADVERIRNDLLACLADVIGYYTKNDSTSIKAETARKLSLSMVYNIDTYLKTLGDWKMALREISERRMSELYGKGYQINKNLFEKAKVLYGKVRFTRLKNGSDAYNRALDRYFYHYLLDYDARFSAQDKIYLSLRQYGIDGAFTIDGAVETLQKLLEINQGTPADITVSDVEAK